MDLKKIESNIKTLSIMFTILLILFLSCCVLDKILPVAENSEENFSTSEELGTIEENPEQEESRRYPEKIESNNIVGTTAGNLFQGGKYTEINPEGRIAVNDEFIAFSKKVNDHYNLILQEKETGKDIVIYENCNPRFLHIYDNFILGVKESASKTGISDIVFIYDIISQKSQTFPISTLNVNVTSFIFNGEKYFFTIADSPYIYAMDINGMNIETIVEPQEFTLYCNTIILNIKNNLMFFSTALNNYSYNLETKEIKILENPTEMILPPEYSIFYNKEEQLCISYNNVVIFSGEITAINFDDILYFSSGNTLYCLQNEKPTILYEATTPINEIFIDKNNVLIEQNNEIIFAKKGDTL